MRAYPGRFLPLLPQSQKGDRQAAAFRIPGLFNDGCYSGYDKVENIRRNLCWSHCRHYYIDSIPLTSSGKEIPGSKGAEGRAFIDLLFKVENEIKDLAYEEIREKRQERSRPILDAFWSWVDETAAIPTTYEKLTSALNYSKNQKKHLETFLEDGRLLLGISNVQSPEHTQEYLLLHFKKDQRTGSDHCGCD